MGRRSRSSLCSDHSLSAHRGGGFANAFWAARAAHHAAGADRPLRTRARFGSGGSAAAALSGTVGIAKPQVMVLVDRRDKWAVVAPITHLELDAAVNHEFRIDRVTVITADRLRGRRRRLGIPSRISEMQSKRHGVFARFFAQAPVVAVIRVTGTVADLEQGVVTLLRDELAILAASQLGYAKRSSVGAPAIWGERPLTMQSLLWLGSSGAWTQPNRVYGPVVSLHLGEGWLEFQRQVFFLDLLRLLRGEVPVAKAWRQDLRRAAVLAGLSQTANSLPDAFLWNMIALELLLTRQGETVGDALPARAEALLGWSRNWTEDGFEARIRDAYSRRCRLVHQGDRGCATREDLFFTDDLLLCLLANLVKHPSLFVSKDAVIEFSQRLEAERLLGTKPRVRPRSLRMFRRRYDAKDYEIY